MPHGIAGLGSRLGGDQEIAVIATRKQKALAWHAARLVLSRAQFQSLLFTIALNKALRGK
jgi:hypothetical protein